MEKCMFAFVLRNLLIKSNLILHWHAYFTCFIFIIKLLTKMEVLSWQTRAKLICAVLSLPTPPDSVSPIGEEMTDVIPNNLKQKTVYQFLLVGFEKCGTSTIFKQVRNLWRVITSSYAYATIHAH